MSQAFGFSCKGGLNTNLNQFELLTTPGAATELKNFEFENKFKTSWKLTDKIRLYNLGEVSKLKGNQFYKAKIGVEYVF